MGRAGSCRYGTLPQSRPLPEINEEAQQITVGIGDNKLPMPIFNLVLPVPAFFERNNDFAFSGFDTTVQLIDIGGFDHKIDAPTIGMFERRRAKAPAGPRRFLQHQMHAREVEIRKALLRPAEQYSEPEHLRVEGQ